MRHGVAGRQLHRTSAHRLALRRNLVQSLFEHGEVRTTLVKAREVRGFAERLITMAISGSLADRQRVIAHLTDRSVIPAEHQAEYDRMSDSKRQRTLMSRSGRRYRAVTTRPGAKFTAESIVNRLFTNVAPKMKARNTAKGVGGGYTRIVKLGEFRVGDGGQLAILQLVGESDKPRPKLGEKTERRRRAKVRYAFYAGKGLQRRGRRKSGAKAAAADAGTGAPEASAGGGEGASAS